MNNLFSHGLWLSLKARFLRYPANQQPNRNKNKSSFSDIAIYKASVLSDRSIFINIRCVLWVQGWIPKRILNINRRGFAEDPQSERRRSKNESQHAGEEWENSWPQSNTSPRHSLLLLKSYPFTHLYSPKYLPLAHFLSFLLSGLLDLFRCLNFNQSYAVRPLLQLHTHTLP